MPSKLAPTRNTLKHTPDIKRARGTGIPTQVMVKRWLSLFTAFSAGIVWLIILAGIVSAVIVSVVCSIFFPNTLIVEIGGVITGNASILVWTVILTKLGHIILKQALNHVTETGENGRFREDLSFLGLGRSFKSSNPNYVLSYVPYGFYKRQQFTNAMLVPKSRFTAFWGYHLITLLQRRVNKKTSSTRVFTDVEYTPTVVTSQARVYELYTWEAIRFLRKYAPKKMGLYNEEGWKYGSYVFAMVENIEDFRDPFKRESIIARADLFFEHNHNPVLAAKTQDVPFDSLVNMIDLPGDWVEEIIK